MSRVAEALSEVLIHDGFYFVARALEQLTADGLYHAETFPAWKHVRFEKVGHPDVIRYVPKSLFRRALARGHLVKGPYV